MEGRGTRNQNRTAVAAAVIEPLCTRRCRLASESAEGTHREQHDHRANQPAGAATNLDERDFSHTHSDVTVLSASRLGRGLNPAREIPISIVVNPVVGSICGREKLLRARKTKVVERVVARRVHETELILDVV